MALAWALCPPGFSTRAGDRFWLAQRYRSQAAGKAGFVAWEEGAVGRDPELPGQLAVSWCRGRARSEGGEPAAYRGAQRK